MPEQTKLTALFSIEKDTRETVCFAEIVGTEPPICNTIYIQKYAVNRLGRPAKIRVTIELA